MDYRCGSCNGAALAIPERNTIIITGSNEDMAKIKLNKSLLRYNTSVKGNDRQDKC